MSTLTTKNAMKMWKYEFLHPYPTRKCKDGKRFLVHWKGDDGKLLYNFVKGGRKKAVTGFIGFDDLSEDLQAKYCKTGKTRKKIRVKTPPRKRRKIPVLERANQNAAIIPVPQKTKVPQVLQVAEMHGKHGKHPVYELQRSVFLTEADGKHEEQPVYGFNRSVVTEAAKNHGYDITSISFSKSQEQAITATIAKCVSLNLEEGTFSCDGLQVSLKKVRRNVLQN